MSLEYRIGDVFDRLAEIPDGSIDLIVTSPPFLALRSYLPADHPDKAREIGSEATPADFLDTLLGLSAEWGRVLAPHGSLCVELGDTFSGSTAEGSDTRGLGRVSRGLADGVLNDKKGAGWPLAKSLTGIPTLYPWSLAYGRNLLTGQPSPAGQWRIRNLIVWARPNPPVGALGDKFRPATSYITVACKSAKRYFDLDAVRVPGPSMDRDGEKAGYATKSGQDGVRGFARDCPTIVNHPAGAPPLDWHADNHPEDGDWLWKLSTQPYKGSHYATYPLTLPKRLIEAMCPLRVCTVCGKPSERISDTTESYKAALASTNGGKGRGDLGDDPNVRPVGGTWYHHGHDRREFETLGWSDCGHGSYRCSACHVLVPSDYALRRPRQGPSSETQVSDEAVLGEPVEVATSQTQHARGVRTVRDRVHGSAGRAMLQSELFGETGPLGGSSTDSASPIEPIRATATQGSERGDLCAGVGAGGLPRQTEQRLDDGASQGDAGTPRSGTRTVGDRPSSQRDQDGQPGRKSGSGDEGEARRNGDVPALSGDVRGPVDGYVCPCGSRDVEYVVDHWRTGVVLDPFAGSGTTLDAAQAVGRHAIGVDLDHRNADLAQARVGMFLTVDAGAA